MRHPVRALALACALAATPACASLRIGETQLENPIAAAQTPDQRAYAALHAYAALIEEAADIVRDPAVPTAFKRTLGQAERAATPAVATLEIAAAAYLRARADFDAAPSADRTAIERATAALAIAAQRLSEAMAAAETPIAELEALIRARRN